MIEINNAKKTVRLRSAFVREQSFSFTKAADALHVTQPTLSKMVKMLESELGAELFDRSATPIELTDSGDAILRSARGILLSLDRMTQELDEVIRLEKGTVRLGIPPMIGVHFFPSAIEKFHSLLKRKAGFMSIPASKSSWRRCCQRATRWPGSRSSCSAKTLIFTMSSWRSAEWRASGRFR
ncbi:hypothetical protein BG53_14670 [Paenibacillus darwinianus]|uniref:HTH lysR-type domain-containing protein n=2 Tax=Paenibacillus darwinianus TaxID=1380763 RepID=A0A9W5S2J5_9BACL|nr:hypothetical protein BG52_14935 [Paenibacillus darwinianus]EXX89885.1 hypothetical protein BG53_14670 [Paenibacillus darwinianus]EXX90134.1 hypothetical protein CH50_16075 [Paenibacillus darwinianus]